MIDELQRQVEEAEEELRLAMLHSDVEALDNLIAPELIFTTHQGHVLGKQDDLSAHQSGLFKIEKLKLSDRHVHMLGEGAIVSVHAHLAGDFAGTRSEDNLRYTRIWARSATGKWQVVAGHSSVVV